MKYHPIDKSGWFAKDKLSIGKTKFATPSNNSGNH